MSEIRELREAAGLTQSEAAGKPQVSDNPHLRSIEVHSASAGRGESANETIELVLDERFLEGTELSVGTTEFRPTELRTSPTVPTIELRSQERKNPGLTSSKSPST